MARDQRIIKVTGFLVIKEGEPGYERSLDLLDAWPISTLKELSMTEMPVGRWTRKGIRTDGKGKR